MRTLIYEYKQSLRELKKMKEAIEAKPELLEQDIQDKSLINSMISEVEFAIQWMVSGRNPGAMRGADRTGAYTLDPAVLDILPVAPVYKSIARELSSLEKEIIEDALCTLTKREKDVFMLVKVEGITFEYTAELLGITKSSVQTYLERAEKKIENRKNGSLFLVS
ncbi:sigma factor-like helix-turn-helix DNA-binding protein [Domibacillus enclensis]|uniref:RNA polymerase sigma-70 factor, ECF subfamily n=1 Tax=Domibacillus enclensis TaxID=1017273 RepID=A0A1N6WI45_9BACI|nr:sigma factor-like helix-turn-helix DNA-binding protein [Domibacillus enclensis]OXS77941.1 hypothetical protein B1B05_10065 [Domibacillus enclensis]SIQ89773.1 RNA polymerase sigma-70 factor, ECF subfamily [Domibacillus enclensis]